jgi:ribosome biogenesis GTPase A
VVPLHIPIEQFRSKLKDLKLSGKEMLVLKIIDIFDFNGSFIPDFYKIVGDNPVVLVANKVDLLPEKVSYERITVWLRRAAKESGLKVKQIYLISAENSIGISKLLEDLPALREGHDVYVMGTSNTGKSTFINKVMETLGQGKRRYARATISHVPGTFFQFFFYTYFLITQKEPLCQPSHFLWIKDIFMILQEFTTNFRL